MVELYEGINLCFRFYFEGCRSSLGIKSAVV